ncbi:MAG: dockerin type I repeat-containing protein [Ruminococcus sp.]|nr:dockerin type I repeat-containing protein [Ruminococcus sp.]
MKSIQKRTVAVCAVVVSLLLLMTAVMPGAAAGKTFIIGDTNGDGRVSVDDVTMIQRLLADIETDEDGMRTLRGDVDGNGLSVSDATLIQQYLAEFDIDISIGETVTITEPVTESTGQTFTTDPYELPFAPC